MVTQKWRIAVIAVLSLALCLALTAACLGDKGEKDQKFTIDQLPAAVRATLEDQAKSCPIEDIEKETEDGVTFYSADIIQGDKKLGVEIGEDGKLLNSEIEAKDCEKDEVNGKDDDSKDEVNGKDDDSKDEVNGKDDDSKDEVNGKDDDSKDESGDKHDENEADEDGDAD